MPIPDNTGTTFSSLTGGVSNPQTDNTTNYNVGILINQNNVAEGPTIPPIQQGEFRIPRPNGFSVTSITSAKPMGSLIVFTWQDIESFGSEIGEYRILANFAYDNNATPVEVGSSQNSPCTVQVLAPIATAAVFFLRPYLTNGQTLPLEQCPSCAVNIPGPVFQLQEGDDIVYIDGSRPSSGGPGSTTVETFDMNGTWLCPPNVILATVECWGAGGKAGNSNSASAGGSGGGGGAYATSDISVTPGAYYSINVANGGTELPTWFGNAGVVSADAGKNGADNGGTPGSAGLAASSIGTTTTSGTVGSIGGNPTGGNGGAAAGGGGAGGAGTSIAGGSPGDTPGGGGGGGGAVSSTGGSGASGRVKLTYSTSGGSGSSPGIGIVNSNGQLSSLTDGSLLFINTSGKITTALGTSGGAGFLQLSDGTAADDVVYLSGSANSAGASAGKYLNVTLGGTAYKIQLFAV